METPALSRITSASPVPIFRSSAFRVSAVSSVDDDPAGLWWIGPSTPAGARAVLDAAGLALVDEMTMMSAPLDAIGPQPCDAVISRVAGSSALHGWASAYTGGHGHPSSVEREWYHVMAAVGLAGPLRHYVARVDGVPVACASVLLAAGVAGLYSVATPPAWRGRGYGTAVTVYALADARAAGYGTAVLGAEDVAVNLYRRLGFRAVGEMRVYAG